MPNRIKYNYHVFGLTSGNKRKNEHYIMEGPSSNMSEPFVIHRLRHVASEICATQVKYLNDQVEEDFLSEHLRYLGISFEPTCDNVIYDKKIYRTQRLSDNEQKSLLRHLRSHF